MKIQRDRDAQLAAAAQSKAMIKAHEQNVHLASHKHRVFGAASSNETLLSVRMFRCRRLSAIERSSSKNMRRNR